MTVVLAGIAAGQAYFNTHTSNFEGGEMRGYLVFDHAVPEPGLLLLAATGLAALALRQGSRRQG
jgi:PEP-CTERM motif-containing protein